MRSALRATVPTAIAIWAAVVVFAAAAGAGELRALAFMTLFVPHAHW